MLGVLPGRGNGEEQDRPTAERAIRAQGWLGRGPRLLAGLKDAGIVWREAPFTDCIHNPKDKVSGTKLVYAGLKDEQKIKDLIAYLKQFDASGKKAGS